MIRAKLFYLYIRSLLEKANFLVSAYGPQQAALLALRQHKVHISVSKLTSETQRVLTYERVIVICNHNYDIEPIVLMSALPNRDSVRIIVNTVYLGLIPSIDTYLIPVKLNHIVNPQGLMHKVQDLRYGTNRFEAMSREQNHSHNIVAIDTASKQIDKGSMIVIFPFPSWAPHGEWYTGVGHMLFNTSCEKPIYVLNVNILGTTNYDWLRFLPFANKLLPPLRIVFDEPYQVNELRSQNGKQITRQLERKYRKWLENSRF